VELYINSTMCVYEAHGNTLLLPPRTYFSVEVTGNNTSTGCAPKCQPKGHRNLGKLPEKNRKILL